MNDKVMLVTGANSGMGRATAASLADTGARVVMLCRDKIRGEEALMEVLEQNRERRLELMLCDLGDMNDIRRFTQEFKNKYGRLDVLVNNAGVITLDRRETKDGLELQFGVNHIGHFLLTVRLLDIIPGVSGGRIVVVGSGAHKMGKIHFEDINLTRGYNVMSAYGQSKLANLLFTRELARRLEGTGITVNCAHPGAVATSMGVDRKTGFGKSLTGLLKPFFQTPEQGAGTALFLALDPSVKEVSGEYFYKCKIAGSSKASKNEKLARELFELSERLTGEKLVRC
ncbi:(S)-1-phenylethanol dehydrogenase [Ruminiclostridium hungatei]|uniref:(S)-1-phenylethanol dehydrogenase n=1 Tax=Ruminiclostridium hungatei TaxID=48256 RepID=A0A1V4SLK0_RUMHU|nr:SDR family oxidoreductase [Ruminiclostridium hungatei]OPX44376.1 (S)-1-phenylethanol dehydrogenase [Ruminiclostridium hungatei]